MGCSVSKSVTVRENSTKSTANNIPSNERRTSHNKGNNKKHSITSKEDNNATPLNVFPDAPIIDNEEYIHPNPCVNAKPRLLKSAIRRTPLAQLDEQIRPILIDSARSEIEIGTESCVDTERSNINNNNSSSSTDNKATVYNNSNNSNQNNTNLISEFSRCPDSGFGTTSAFSDNLDRSKSSMNVVGNNKSRNQTPSSLGINRSESLGSRPGSGKTGSILTTSALNTSFITTATGADDDLGFGNSVDVSLDLHTPFSEYTDADLDLSRTASITPAFRTTSVTPASRINSATPASRTNSVTPATPSGSAMSSDMYPMMYPKHIGVIREESEGGFTPRSIDIESHSHNGFCNNSDNRSRTLHDLRMQNNDSLTPRRAAVKKMITFKCPNISNTPRSYPPNLPIYLPKEISAHNQNVGCREFTVYNGKVHKTQRIIEVFDPMVEDFIEFKTREGEHLKEEMQLSLELNHKPQTKAANDQNKGLSSSNDENEYSSEEEEDFLSEDYENIQIDICNGVEFKSQMTWDRLGIQAILRLELPRDILHYHLPECCVGQVALPYSSRYWDDVRGDIKDVLEHLVTCDAHDLLNRYQEELKDQLQGWINQYRFQNPEQPRDPDGDPNKISFPLPCRTLQDPESLRIWYQNFEKLDTFVPEDGAWCRYEVDEIDLGDPDQIFQETLRYYVSEEELSPFDFSIAGSVAWNEVPSDIVKNDVMTPDQETIDRERRQRTDLDDPHRMERRRNKLMIYFIRKYELVDSYVRQFNCWTVAMEEGDRRFQELCNLP